MSDNVATLEQPTTTQVEQQQSTDQTIQATPDVSQIMADSLWGMNNTPYQNVETVPAAAETATASAEQQQPAAEIPAANADEILDEDDFIRRVTGGLGMDEFKTKWEQLNKPQEQPTPQEIQWANEDSKRFFDLLKEGKEDDVYNFLNQKKQLERLEKYDVADATQAGEILRANLQFKYKDTLSTQEIDRLYNKQYAMPAQPAQTLDQTDEEYAGTVQAWEDQVKERQMDMIIEAKMTKPELSKLRSQIVLPDIQKQVAQQGPTQEELADLEAKRNAYLGAIESSYQNFKGFTVTAKDGEVQMPISYSVSPEEIAATKQTISDFNVNEFFGSRWFDDKGTPNVTLMQEDLYLLANRDKIFNKIATEAFTQMKAHLIKTQNNINLKGVSPTLGPTQPGQQAPKSDSQLVADRIWSM